MADLISRTSLLRNIGRYGVSIDPYNITRLITQKILAEPEVDAVEVVRCRDCEFSRLVHLEDGSVFEGTLHCFTGRGYQQNVFGREYSVISPNNFCASGRRKMDAEVRGDE